MHAAQRAVEEFHRAMDLPIGDTPEIRRPELRANLIMEEAIETVEALTGRKIYWNLGPTTSPPSLVKVADGLCDLFYVAYGTAVEAGIDIEPFFDEVHRSNLAKAGGPRRSDGKVLKPGGWISPDLGKILSAQIERARARVSS